MTKRELTNGILKHLKLDGFKSVGLGGNAVCLSKEDSYAKDTIIFSYIKSQNFYTIDLRISGWKSIHEVERKIQKLHKDISIEYNDTTIIKDSGNNLKPEKLKIYSLEDLNELKSKLKPRIDEVILPFFKKFSSIHKVNEEIERIGTDYHSLGKFLFPPFLVKKMVIKHLLNTSDWRAFAIDTLNYYQNENNKNHSLNFQNYARIVPELYKQITE